MDGQFVSTLVQTFRFFLQFLFADWLLKNVVGDTETYGENPDVIEGRGATVA